MTRGGRSVVSQVWQFFDRIQNDGKTTDVLCKLCDKQYKYCGNTSNLRAHLKNTHPIQWELADSGSLNTKMLQKMTEEAESDTDVGQQSEQEIEHHELDEDGVTAMHLIDEIAPDHSDEEWLEEPTPLKKKRAKRMSYSNKRIKREVVSPPPNTYRISSIKPLRNIREHIEKPIVKEPPKDECTVFGEYIASKLRNFKKPRTRGNIQQMFSTILWQAEYGVYDQPDSVRHILAYPMITEAEKPQHVINVTLDQSEITRPETTDATDMPHINTETETP